MRKRIKHGKNMNWNKKKKTPHTNFVKMKTWESNSICAQPGWDRNSFISGFLNVIFIYFFNVSSYLILFPLDTILLFFNFYFFLILKSLILTCVPKHEPPSHLPPHNISLGHPHAPAPSMLYPTPDIDWRFNSYMIVYMLECHSPKSSHLLLLPLSPKVRYTHLRPFCCLAYRVVIAIFLNSIYVC